MLYGAMGDPDRHAGTPKYALAETAHLLGKDYICLRHYDKVQQFDNRTTSQSTSLLLVFRFLLSFFVEALYRPPWPFPNITH